jgi:hypothetical protein
LSSGCPGGHGLWGCHGGVKQLPQGAVKQSCRDFKLRNY